MVVKRCILVAVCLASLAPFACSPGEVERHGEAGGVEADGRASDGGGAAEGAGFASPAGSPGEDANNTGRSFEIGRAVLGSAGSRDVIHVSVRFSGSEIWPRCSLLDGPSRSAALQGMRHRHPPRAEGWTRRLWSEMLWEERESPWSDRRDTEAVLLNDGTILLTFPEDPSQGNRATDPRRMPFFARCTGGEVLHVLEDEAHVVGPPRARS